MTTAVAVAVVATTPASGDPQRAAKAVPDSCAIACPRSLSRERKKAVRQHAGGAAARLETSGSRRATRASTGSWPKTARCRARLTELGHAPPQAPPYAVVQTLLPPLAAAAMNAAARPLQEPRRPRPFASPHCEGRRKDPTVRAPTPVPRCFAQQPQQPQQQQQQPPLTTTRSCSSSSNSCYSSVNAQKPILDVRRPMATLFPRLPLSPRRPQPCALLNVGGRTRGRGARTPGPGRARVGGDGR